MASWVENIRAILTQTDKQAGATPTVGSVSTDWNTPADICTIGANDVSNKVLSLTLAIDAATGGAVITVNMYMQVDGVERKVYSQNFLAGTDPDGLWIIQSVVAIHEALRVEVSSDVSETVEFDFDYMLEVM